jgi:hypothetical protein
MSDFTDLMSGYSVREGRVFDHRGDEVFVPTSVYNLLVRYGMALAQAGGHR